MTDGGFFTGEGTVTGTVTRAGDPAAGVEVSLSGSDRRTGTDAAGRFRLEGVPAGIRAVIARDGEECLAARAQVRVADGRISSAGELELAPAGRLEVQILDPQLPIGGCGLSLAELPWLRATSDDAGTAAFDCLPPGTCYSVRVVSAPLPFSFADARLCPPAAPPWPVTTIVPGKDSDYDLARALNALRQAARAAEPLLACGGSCAVPDWWRPEQGPPCPLPLGDLADPQGYQALHDLLAQLHSLDRFSTGEAAVLGCPPAGAFSAACRRGTCRLDQPPGPAAEILWQGQGPTYCAANDTSLLSGPDEAAGAASCLGLDLPAAGGPFLLLRHQLDLEIVSALVVEDPPGALSVYLRALLPGTARALPDVMASYLLLGLIAAPPGLETDDISAAISWVEPER